MCELCSNDNDEREQARAEHLRFAERLDALARDYRALGLGRVLPHSDRAGLIAIRAKNVIRHLVSEWV